jgi:hypothetical protein
VCGGELAVTRLQCLDCDVAIEGHFELGRLAKLTPQQVSFVETFIRCEGKFTRVGEELGISYPTVRSRLDDVIVALGYQPKDGAEVDDEDDEEDYIEDAAALLSEDERRAILADLEAGRLSPSEAITRLRAKDDDDEDDDEDDDDDMY